MSIIRQARRDLAKLNQSFIRWRKNKKHIREAVPFPLLAEAEKLASRLSDAEVISELGIQYKHLRKIRNKNGPRTEKRADVGKKFVDISSHLSPGDYQTQITLLSRHGVKLELKSSDREIVREVIEYFVQG